MRCFTTSLQYLIGNSMHFILAIMTSAPPQIIRHSILEVGDPCSRGVPSVVGGGLCRRCHRPGCWGLPCVEAASCSLVVPGPKEAGCRAPWDLELVLTHWWAWPGSRERQGCCPPTGGWSQVLGLVPDDWQAEPCPGVWLQGPGIPSWGQITGAGWG